VPGVALAISVPGALVVIPRRFIEPARDVQ
jgi:hypothetical protein